MGTVESIVKSERLRRYCTGPACSRCQNRKAVHDAVREGPLGCLGSSSHRLFRVVTTQCNVISSGSKVVDWQVLL
jgi:hypothetical protein